MSGLSGLAAPGPRQPNKLTATDYLTCLGKGLLYYSLSTLVVLLGVLFAHSYLKPSDSGMGQDQRLIDSFFAWDGLWYRRITVEGYSHTTVGKSPLCFFPGYPILGQLVVALTGLSADVALLLISHGCFAATCVLLMAYVKQRFPDGPRELADYVVLSLGLLPCTYFFRMGYSESLFIFLTVLALYGMERRWPLLVIALVVGAATATRPVGVGLLVPLVLHVWHRAPTAWSAAGRTLLLVPVACWGLFDYMLYQLIEFNEPFAFLTSLGAWRRRTPVPFLDKMIALLTFEPVWFLVSPGSAISPDRPAAGDPHFSLPYIFNSVSFVVAVALLLLGAFRRWLTSYEVTLAVPLLLIPYVTRGYDYMASAARFASVVFPLYLVLGYLLCRLPGPLAAGLLALSSLFLGSLAGLFVSWYPFF
jgi:hypothetical protein